VVGNKEKFNQAGIVPVNATKRNLLHSNIENDWVYLPLIKALVALSALLHDWGKASQLFQEKLNPQNNQAFKGDPIRHEWVSCLLLHALIQTSTEGKPEKNDNAWLSVLSNGVIDEVAIQDTVMTNRVNPISGLPPIAKLVAWLVASHHRLPINEHVCMRSES
ncbi:MAG: HD domain-containing protein, partial [Sinobacterium sp.]